MCGICGIIKKSKIEKKDMALLESMNETLIHRGPDDAGLFEENNIAMGHRRLSIIDLTDAGHQPMEYGKRYVIVFNGEIYNYLELKKELIEKGGYEFQTETDTEIIMASYDYWGTACFSKFNGMWAIALYDRFEKKIIISRDRLGVKPLYYYCDDKLFLFASEIKAVLKNKNIVRIANEDAVYDYLSQGLVDHTNNTFFKDIYQFPKGHYAIIDDSLALEFKEYWNLAFNNEIGSGINEENVETFRKKFSKAVMLRLRADVPIGSCLSGGLDSSAIVCAIHKLNKNNQRQHTFSYRADNEKLDEYKYMKAVIDDTMADAHFVTPQIGDLLNDLDKLIYHQDEPFSTTGMYAGYRVYKTAQENGVKVLLDGQGADELLCGYRKSRIFYIKRLWEEKKLKEVFRELVSSFSQVQTSMLTNSGRKSDINKIKRILFRKKRFDNIDVDFYNKSFIENIHGYDYNRNENFQYNDLFKISLPALLRYTDRNSMAFSVESRLPFLDYEFVELCAELTLSEKLYKGYSKVIMRKALKMPRLVRERKDKMGFATPEDEWIQKGEADIKKIFMNESFKASRFINKELIINNWDSIIYNNAIPYFFRIICLERWMQLFDVK